MLLVEGWGFSLPPAFFHGLIEFPFLKQNEEEDHAMQALLLFSGSVSQLIVPPAVDQHDLSLLYMRPSPAWFENLGRGAGVMSRAGS